MPFYQTNPPFFDGFFAVSYSLHISYERNTREKSVGSFWKTNPPEGGLWGRFHRKMGSFPENEPKIAAHSEGYQLHHARPIF